MDYTSFLNEVVAECGGVPNPIALSKIRQAFREFCRESVAYRHLVAPGELSYSAGVYTISVPTGFQIDTVISPVSLVVVPAYPVLNYSNGTINYNTTDQYTPLLGFEFTGETTQTALSYTLYTYQLNSNHSITYNSTDSSPMTGYSFSISTTVTAPFAKEQEFFGTSPEWMGINHPGWMQWAGNEYPRYFVMKSPTTFVLAPDNGADRSSNITMRLVLMPDHTTALPTLDTDFCTRWFDFIVSGAKALLMAMPEWSNPQLALYYKSQFDDGKAQAKAYVRAGYRSSKADGVKPVKSWYK